MSEEDDPDLPYHTKAITKAGNRTSKKRTQRVETLKAELKANLAEPLLARGISTRYPTSGSKVIVDDLLQARGKHCIFSIAGKEAECRSCELAGSQHDQSLRRTSSDQAEQAQQVQRRTGWRRRCCRTQDGPGSAEGSETRCYSGEERCQAQGEKGTSRCLIGWCCCSTPLAGSSHLLCSVCRHASIHS